MTSLRHPSNAGRPRLSPARQRVFFLITLLLPFLLLILGEAALRAFRYGPDLSLFTTIDVAGRTYHVMNPDVKNRYFTGTSFNPATSQELFLVPKPKRTYRIFCLGGSTMIGYPYWYNGAPSTFLRDRLTRLFPSRTIEVINVGMTAVNSFTVADMARDLVRYEPDLFIVYDGHNEFYGALGVASNQTAGGIRWATRLYLRLIHYRTFYLLRDLAGRIAGLFGAPAAREPKGTMMEQLARGQAVTWRGPLYSRALDTFRGNLRELGDICAGQDIPLILSTQVSNLRSFPPFNSGEPPGTTETERSAFTRDFNHGVDAFSAGHFREALGTFRAAEALDSLRADTQFWLARCLDTLGEKTFALSSYVKARDYDRLRFRSSSDFNDAIRAMSDGKTIAVADIESAFARASRDSLIDSTLIFEHLHPRARGYFLMAEEIARTMRRCGLLAPPEQWAAADTTNEEILWDNRPITALDEVAALRRTEILTSRWPFPSGNRRMTPVAPGDILGTLSDRILTGSLTWEYAHVAAAEHYEAQNDYGAAAREYRALINQYPQVVSAYLRLARVSQAMGMRGDAERLYLESLDIEKTPLAYRMLGRLANNSRRFPEAIDFYAKAIPLGSTIDEQSEDRYNLALVFVNAGMIDRGTEELRQILIRNRGYAPARKLLQALSKRQASTQPGPDP